MSRWRRGAEGRVRGEDGGVGGEGGRDAGGGGSLEARRGGSARRRRSLVACVDIDALARRSETSPSELRALERSAALGARAASAASDDDPWSRCANAERLLAESASLGDPLAGAPGSSPGLSAFDCAALPACAPSCAGPNGRLLGSATRVAGCAAEDALHFTVARFLLTGVVFVAANAARGAAVRGAAAVHWKALAGDAGFRFEGTLRADGGVEPPSGGAGKRSEKSVRAVARAEIKRAAAKHVRGGGSRSRSPRSRKSGTRRPRDGETSRGNAQSAVRLLRGIGAYFCDKSEDYMSNGYFIFDGVLFSLGS